MAEFLMGRFQYTYESGATGSYLVISGNSMEKVYNYQVEMIANNPREGILPLDIRRKDDVLAFYYNITSKQPLVQFLDRRKLNSSEVIHVISSITRTLLEARNYLIYDRLFLLDENFMYINPNTLDVSMTYIPLEMECNSVLKFKEFIVKFIMFTISIDESANDLIQKILIDVKRDMFRLADFDRLLMDAKHAPESGEFQNDEKCGVDKIRKQTMSKQIIKPFTNPKQQPQKTSQEDKELRFKIPSIQKSEIKVKKEPISQKSEGSNLQYRNTTLLAAAILQIAVVSTLILTLKSGVLDSVAEDVTTTYSAFALVLGALDFLIMRRLLQAKNKMVVKSAKKNPEIPEKKIKSYEKGEKLLPAEQKKTEVEVAAAAVFSDATALLAFGSNENNLGDSSRMTQPYIVLEENQEKIHINKNGFVIGRLKGRVDYMIRNSAVGKMHAELLERDGMYYIKDLNSRNGTFVNDERIDSNIEYEIRHKDKITVANSQFTFLIS